MTTGKSEINAWIKHTDQYTRDLGNLRLDAMRMERYGRQDLADLIYHIADQLHDVTNDLRSAILQASTKNTERSSTP